jgi:hypothetical protein
MSEVKEQIELEIYRANRAGIITSEWAHRSVVSTWYH